MRRVNLRKVHVHCTRARLANALEGRRYVSHFPLEFAAVLRLFLGKAN